MIELKSVNARALDVKLRLPASIEHLEPAIRMRIAKSIARGSCQLLVQMTRERRSGGLRLNEAWLRELHASLNKVAKSLGADPVGLAALLEVKGVFEAEELPDRAEDSTAQDEAILRDLDVALGALVRARQEEGEALSTVLRDKIDRIADLIDQADAHPSRQPEAVRLRLEELIRLLIGAAPSLDPQRLHQEAVLMATKADIREELDRLKAHVDAARTLLRDGASIGRRLDFLAQEFTRESNTLCAKSADVALTAIGLDLKTLVEQFREQIQNVE